ncbi:unnamed protein product, partial [Musa hybrid cultivar]
VRHGGESSTQLRRRFRRTRRPRRRDPVLRGVRDDGNRVGAGARGRRRPWRRGSGGMDRLILVHVSDVLVVAGRSEEREGGIRARGGVVFSSFSSRGGHRSHRRRNRARRGKTIQRGQATPLGEMGGRDKGPSQGRPRLARHLRHLRGCRPSLRRGRPPVPWKQSQAQLPRGGPPPAVRRAPIIRRRVAVASDYLPYSTLVQGGGEYQRMTPTPLFDQTTYSGASTASSFSTCSSNSSSFATAVSPPPPLFPSETPQETDFLQPPPSTDSSHY